MLRPVLTERLASFGKKVTCKTVSGKYVNIKRNYIHRDHTNALSNRLKVGSIPANSGEPSSSPHCSRTVGNMKVGILAPFIFSGTRQSFVERPHYVR